MISVVIPVHDEENAITGVVDEVEAALEGAFEHEIVVVDDGSLDGTAGVLDELRAARSRLRVIRHDRRCGQSSALRTGARFAKHPWVAVLDGDGQNDPADLRRLWSAKPPHVDASTPWLAIGHRVDRKDAAARRWASRFGNGLRAWWLADHTPDTGCGAKLISRQVLLDLPWFDHAHRFLPALVRRAGGTIVSLPVRHRPRVAGRSKYGIWDRAWAGAWDLLGMRWLQARATVPRARET